MKKCTAALGVLMISLMIPACSSDEPSLGPFYSVGGVVSGLTGTVVLQNNGADDLTITANGSFTFAGSAGPGSSYAVTVLANPASQTCVVSNGTGTVLISPVTNVSLSCFARGGLDVTFHAPDGFLVQDNAAGGAADDAGIAVAVDSRGRLLVAGSSMNIAGNRDMAVWRFTPAGTLDTTLNSTGIVVHDSAAGGAGDDSGKAVAVDSLGRILVTGSSTTAGGATEMVIWRYLDGGTPDMGFSGNGIVSAAAGTGSASGNGIAVDTQDKVLVTGSTTTAAGTTEMAVWRFNANGTVDTAFSGDGMVSTAVGTGNASGNAIAIDPQGKVLVAGSSTGNPGSRGMVVWRFNTNGTLDTTFSLDGIYVINGAAGGTGDDVGSAITVDALGRVLVAGSSVNSAGNRDMVVWRLTSAGAPDTTFNGTGTVISNGAAGSDGDDAGNGIAIDSQGRIIVAGSSTNVAGNRDMVIWRLNPNGTMDISFAAGGIAVHGNAAGGDADDSGSAITVDSQDRILVTGSSVNSAVNSDMVLWRVFP